MSNKLRRNWLGLKNNLKQDKPLWLILKVGKRYRFNKRIMRRRANYPQFNQGEFNRFATYGHWFYGRSELILNGGTQQKWQIRLRLKPTAYNPKWRNKLIAMRWYRETN